MAFAPPEIRTLDSLRMLRFSPTQLGVIVRVTGGNNVQTYDGETLLADHESEIYGAVDGPMYDDCDPASDACAVLEFGLLDSRRGVNIPSARPGDGVTLSIVRGTPVWSDGWLPVAGATQAVQLYPTLVVNGQNAAGANDQASASRVALGQLNDGSLFFAMAPSATLAAFADLLVAAGATYAGYTDGGGSTGMYDAAGLHAGNRAVASWLVIERGRAWYRRPGVLIGASLAALAAFGVMLAREYPEDVAPLRRGWGAVERALTRW